jgi:exodeoxyribonuclease VII small subunit
MRRTLYDVMAEKKEDSFESMLKKLEDVVARLEKGDLPLEESLKAYEEGVGLVRSAQGRLDGMDKKLEQLLKDGTTKAMQSDAEGASGET